MTNFRLNTNVDVSNLASGIFIDSSVWILTHGPQSNPSDVRIGIYSEFLEKVITNEINIYITALNLSEIFNVILGYFKRQSNGSMNNKSYKNTQHYRENLDAIFSYVNAVLTTPNLTFVTLSDNLKYTSKLDDKLDFNDMVYAHLCIENNLVMVTDDADFKNVACDIVSGNTILVNS